MYYSEVNDAYDINGNEDVEEIIGKTNMNFTILAIMTIL